MPSRVFACLELKSQMISSEVQEHENTRTLPSFYSIHSQALW